MNFEVQQNKDEVVITVDGHFTIQYAADLKKAFLKALKLSPQIRLDLSGVKEADLSCLQLIWSVLKTGKKSGKEISFGAALPEVMVELAELAGFPNFEEVCRQESTL